MSLLYLMCFLLFAVGIFLVLKLTPEQIGAEFAALFHKRKSLRERAMTARGEKKTSRLAAEFKRLRTALEETGKGARFSAACLASVFLTALGCVVALLLGNPFLIPALAAIFAMIPFVCLRKSVRIYEDRVKEELETALSIITTSYVRSDNLITAVSENMAYLKPPLKGVFASFLTETGSITPDVRAAIAHLKEKVSDAVFGEWCDTLIACQNDRTLKDTLLPIVSKLTDVRLVNNSLKTMLQNARREYYTMVVMVLANIPLLYVLNRDWYNALMYTTFGKIVLAVCALVIFFTALRMNRVTRPIVYKR